MTAPRIGLLSKTPPDSLPEHWSHFQDLAQLMAADLQDILVIDLPNQRARQLLFQLRSRREYQLTLIYVRQMDESAPTPLSDGPPPPEPEEFLVRFRLWQERLRNFNGGQPPERFEQRVFAWLWTRPRTWLEPERDPEHPQYYRYPLLSAMASDEPVNEMVWLKLMVEQDWLQQGELVNRIRLCSQCNSGRLNYVDVCPQCNEMDIARQPSLHCFTCGHVAPQEHFLKEGLMLCPNCLTRLRHIGSDYDRPLENYRCRSCQNFFVDADVEARCLECDEHHTPDELRIREVRHYQLTEAGRMRCRQGLQEVMQSDQFGRLNLIPPQGFDALLDWQIQQQRRYRDTPPTALLVIRFVNLSAAVNSAEGLGLLDTLIERIQEAVRETDRCCRTREELLWFLLPHTDRAGMNVLWRRLASLTKLFHEHDEMRFEVRLAGFLLNEDLNPEEDGELLMARLAGEVT